MASTQEEIESVARLLVRELDGGPRSKMDMLFRFTLRGFDYDTAIGAIAYGLRVGLLREEGRMLVAGAEDPPSGRPARAAGRSR
jgi:hypothetical protein